MQITMMVLCKTSLQRARKRLGSPNILYNAGIWRDVIEKNALRKNSKSLARAVYKEIDVIRQGRNDFVHAFFAFGEGGDNFSLTRNVGVDYARDGQKPAVAIHNLKANTLENLRTTRDKSAAISQFVFHIYKVECGIPEV